MSQFPRTLGPQLWSVTQADIDAYAQLSGANDPLHVDPAFARTTRFGSTIAQGLLVFGRLSRLVSAELESVHKQRRVCFQVAFHAAVRPGDIVKLEGQLIEEIVGVNCAYKLSCYRSDGKKLIEGLATLWI